MTIDSFLLGVKLAEDERNQRLIMNLIGQFLQIGTTAVKTNMILLDMVMARRKLQLTLLKSRFASDTKIKTGRENFPTNIFSPLESF